MQITEYETLPKDVSRSAYTIRILEIVSNIKKQKEEITKVCIDSQYHEVLTISAALTSTVFYPFIWIAGVWTVEFQLGFAILLVCGRFCRILKTCRKRLMDLQESLTERLL